MSRDIIYVLLMALAAVCLLGGLVYALSNIFGILLVIAIGCGLNFALEGVYPSPASKGWVAAAVIGLVGAVVGQFMVSPLVEVILKTSGPMLFKVKLIPTILGSIVIGCAWRAKATVERATALEAYKAKAQGNDPLLMAQVDDYRIIRYLGSGGYSRVYAGVPDRTLRESDAVAIKVFTETALEGAGFADRLRREVELCQTLQHPNIVRVIKAAEQKDLHYLIMELVVGDTLQQRLKQGLMPLPDAVEVLTDLASGMAHAHAKGIIHRDIKPENVVISKSGPKIMDFGLARLEGTSSLTQSGSAIGTPHYMSPEQVQGEKVLDGRCDQYALGGVAFEMVTGEKLFDSDQAVLVLMKHMEEKPRDPRTLRPEIPEALSKIILRMLEKLPADRYPSMDVIFQELMKLGNLKSLPTKPAGATKAPEDDKAVASPARPDGPRLGAVKPVEAASRAAAAPVVTPLESAAAPVGSVSNANSDHGTGALASAPASPGSRAVASTPAAETAAKPAETAAPPAPPPRAWEPPVRPAASAAPAGGLPRPGAVSQPAPVTRPALGNPTPASRPATLGPPPTAKPAGPANTPLGGAKPPSPKNGDSAP